MKKVYKKLIELYKNSGRVAFIYPRLKLISLGGGYRIPLNEGMKQIKECLKKDKSEEEIIKEAEAKYKDISPC